MFLLHAIPVSFTVSCLNFPYQIRQLSCFLRKNSLTVTALLSSYIISLCCVPLKRWGGETVLTRRWSLGRSRAPLDVNAIFYLSLAFFLTLWPLDTSFAAKTFNWTISIYSAIHILASIHCWTSGRHIYDGPVVLFKMDI